jgi:prevent-host-death family protein
MQRNVPCMCYCRYMKSIGIRELRQNASRYLRQVEAGESLRVTDHGRPIAMIVPMPTSPSGLDALRRDGRVRTGSGRLDDCQALPPVVGRPLPSEVLEAMRAHER